MKKAVSFFLLLLVGCSATPTTAPEDPGPDPLTGEWQGRIYNGSTWDAEAYIILEDGQGLGITRLYYGTSAYFQPFSIHISTAGNSASFIMIMDFGPNLEAWRYSGFVSDEGELCLNRDLFGVPTWCIPRVEGPSLDMPN